METFFWVTGVITWLAISAIILYFTVGFIWAVGSIFRDNIGFRKTDGMFFLGWKIATLRQREYLRLRFIRRGLKTDWMEEGYRELPFKMCIYWAHRKAMPSGVIKLRLG